jgi:hypothetical protein
VNLPPQIRVQIRLKPLAIEPSIQVIQVHHRARGSRITARAGSQKRLSLSNTRWRQSPGPTFPRGRETQALTTASAACRAIGRLEPPRGALLQASSPATSANGHDDGCSSGGRWVMALRSIESVGRCADLPRDYTKSCSKAEAVPATARPQQLLLWVLHAADAISSGTEETSNCANSAQADDAARRVAALRKVACSSAHQHAQRGVRSDRNRAAPARRAPARWQLQ